MVENNKTEKETAGYYNGNVGMARERGGAQQNSSIVGCVLLPFRRVG